MGGEQKTERPYMPLCTFPGKCPSQFTDEEKALRCSSATAGAPECAFKAFDPPSATDILRAAQKAIDEGHEGPLIIDMRKRLKVAFDIDMTLIDGEGRPRYHVIWLLKWFAKNGEEIYAWSGGGIGYTKQWLRRLGLDDMAIRVVDKFSTPVDIAIDDMADGIDISRQLNAKVIIKV